MDDIQRSINGRPNLVESLILHSPLLLVWGPKMARPFTSGVERNDFVISLVFWVDTWYG